MYVYSPAKVADWVFEKYLRNSYIVEKLNLFGHNVHTKVLEGVYDLLTVHIFLLVHRK